MFLSKRSNGIYYLWLEDELGKPRKVSTGCTHKSAALQFLHEFKAEQHERKAKQQRMLLSQFKQDFLEYVKSNRTGNTQKALDVALKVLIDYIGDVPVQKVGIRDIERFLAHKKASGCSDYTLRFYYIALASAFETARRWNYISTNPFRSVEKPKTRDLQPLHFTKDDFRAVLTAVDNNDFRELCVFAVSTGLRLSELTALQWTDLDLHGKLIWVRNSETFTTKTKRNRAVPMTEQLWQLLISRKDRASCELVFHENGRQLTKNWVSTRFKRYARKALGTATKLHFHSLRHTFATWLVQDGVSLYEVQKLLGHSNISVTEIYSHLQPEQLHHTVNRVGFSLN